MNQLPFDVIESFELLALTRSFPFLGKGVEIYYPKF